MKTKTIARMRARTTPDRLVFTLLKYVFFAVLMFLLFKCVLSGSSTHFALAFLWALVWCNQNVYALSLLLVAAAFCAGVPIITVAIFAGAAGVLCFAFFIHKTLKKRLNMLLLNIYLFASQLLFFWNIAGDISLLARLSINIMFTIIFFNCVVFFLQPMLLRRGRLKFCTDEILGGIVLLIMLAAGLSQLQIKGVHIGALPVYFAIIFAAFSFKNFNCIMLACICGIGYVVANGDASMLAMFVGFALTLFAFCRTGKIPAVIAALASTSCLVFFFKILGTDYINAAVPAAAAVLIFLVKDKSFAAVRDAISPQKVTASEQIAEFSKRAMQKRLQNASECFLAIEKVFRKNIRETVDIKNAQQVLKSELTQKVCSGCPKQQMCSNMPGMDGTLGKIVNSSLVRGKATILDVPPALAARCTNIGEIVALSNDLAVRYLKFNTLQKNKSVGTQVASDQMHELSRAVLAISQTMLSKQTYNVGVAAEAESALTRENIAVKDVVCEEVDAGRLIVTVHFKKGEYIDIKKVEQIVSKICRCRLEAVQSAQLNFEAKAGTSENVVVLQSCPNLDAVFGVASSTKTGSSASGDCHSFMRMSGGKIAFSLCDGMGSGDKARQISEEAIELIEAFSRAGFETSAILDSVNKLLSLGGGEEFVAIDLCVLDLWSSEAKIFKLATPESIIVNERGFDIVEGGALPIGVSVEVQSKIEGRLVSGGDLLVLLSDGVRDVWPSTTELLIFIEECNTTNPQQLADAILERVREMGKGAFADDATVVCVRVFEKP